MAEQQKPARSLRLRRQNNEEKQLVVSLETVTAIVEKGIQTAILPMQKQIAILQSNSIIAGLVLRNIRDAVITSELSGGSTKERLEELLSLLTLSMDLVTSYAGLPPVDETEAARTQMQTARMQGVFRHLREQVLYGGGTVGEGAMRVQDEGDDIIENLSSREFDPPF